MGNPGDDRGKYGYDMTTLEQDFIPEEHSEKPLAKGVAAIRQHLVTMPAAPGVYRMVDERGDVLYVGKAKSLKARVTSYTNTRQLSQRIRRMVARTRSLTVVTTHTEVEALLLEANLIKRFRPQYNILLKDDKTFPYVRIELGHPFPRVTKHRGARSDKGEYFGPFASAGAVAKTLNVLQRAFLLRTCTDSVFASRSRPCLLYQIKRCAAPCVGRISEKEYAALIADARDFMTGRSQRLKEALSEKMLAASENLDFESAAIYRDRLKALSHVQQHQDINNLRLGDADVIAAHQDGGETCVQVFFIRGGHNWGNRAFFPRHDKGDSAAAVLTAFLSQFYEDKTPPHDILLSDDVEEAALIAEALSTRAGHTVKLNTPKRGQRRNLVEMALANAKASLERRLAESSTQAKLLDALAETFGLEAPPRRIEVYDNSHISGTKALGAMIVAGPEGFEKNSYRKFNIRSDEIALGDDFAMMREVMSRRFGRLAKEDPNRDTAAWPDLVLIDGGLGQLNAVRATLADLGIEDVPLIAIAKGQDRNAGREDFYLPDRAPFKLDPNSPVLYYVQRLRDEAHRFAIGGNRARRLKDARKSLLDAVPGIGPRRKRALLLHFGSAQAVANAGINDLAAAPGVSRATAKVIYDFFHEK